MKEFTLANNEDFQTLLDQAPLESLLKLASACKNADDTVGFSMVLCAVHSRFGKLIA